MALLRTRAKAIALADEADRRELARVLAARMEREEGRAPGESEVASWAESLPALGRELEAAGLGDVPILIEQRMPASSRRADVVLAGTHPVSGEPSYVVIELKQWSRVTPIQGSEELFLVPGMRNHPQLHPLVQAVGYRDHLTGDLEVLHGCEDRVEAIAYLHNAQDAGVAPLLESAHGGRQRVFTRQTTSELHTYLRQRLAPESGEQAADLLESSPFRFSPAVLERAADVLAGRHDYVLVDGQRTAYELVRRAVDSGMSGSSREVVIVSGGPGAGKTVVALSLLADMAKQGRSTALVAASGAVTDTLRHYLRAADSRLETLVRSVNDIERAAADSFDLLVCDEAQRLRDEPGWRSATGWRPGKNGVRALCRAAKSVVFLLDDDQAVRPSDAGSVESIRRMAEAEGRIVRRVRLDGQFRCGGSAAYGSWVRDLLGFGGRSPQPWRPDSSFRVRVADSPWEMEQILAAEQGEGHRTRIAAGYCWPWSHPRRDGSLVPDVTIRDWHRPWNVRSTRPLLGLPPSTLWATAPGGEGQIGCIYTAQGLEYEWGGVILGPDYVFGDSGWQGRPEGSADDVVKRADTRESFEQYVRNAYQVLLTRATRGIVLHSTDARTHSLIRQLVSGDR
ncbi:DUF2075 domain-containing protein [Peterkaempfera bronchialis]|uniref:DUF2075 domain-containing protein n=1 Tax=Peterkaempfera bronchialis TaxID=2126346 RepID=A0A345SV90_9ACTN|nr:DUF2075 domain-containing protein [Peterkaempfera bronchialis]AXI77645.1 DUF2075 domain-containing protein [Peterkaempfera bronchialis]